MTGVEGMIGGKAEVIQNGRGTLKVFFRSEIWDAVSKEDLSVGRKVEVTGVDRMRLMVRQPTDLGSMGSVGKGQG